MSDKKELESEPIKIYSAQDAITGEMVCNLLRNEGIACYRQELETGNYMNLYMGYSVFGEDIYVNSRDVDRAGEVLEVMKPEEETSQEDPAEEETGQSIPFYKKKRVVVWIYLIVMAGGTLFLYILTYLANHGYF